MAGSEKENLHSDKEEGPKSEYSKYKVAELKEILKERNIEFNSKSLKSDLMSKLLEYDALSKSATTRRTTNSRPRQKTPSTPQPKDLPTSPRSRKAATVTAASSSKAFEPSSLTSSRRHRTTKPESTKPSEPLKFIAPLPIQKALNLTPSAPVLHHVSDRDELDKAYKELEEFPENLSLFSQPLATLYLFGQFVLFELKALISTIHPIFLFSLFMLLMIFLSTPYIKETNGPHVEILMYIERLILWYGKWFLYGVASSIGFGSGMHTFVLFLAPLIAETTLAAFTCNSLSFDLEGPNRFKCAHAGDVFGTMTVWKVFMKVALEAFFWGAGTAFGELPPYFFAKASAKAKKSSSSSKSSKKPLIEDPTVVEENWLTKCLTMTFGNLNDKVKLMITRFGFFGILACASIPNPLFDLAGMTCGYYGIPFMTFFLATFIGKALIKATLQTLFVICLMSKDAVDFALMAISHLSPDYGARLAAYLEAQKGLFLNRNGPTAQVEASVNLIAEIWNYFIIFMIVYFSLTCIQDGAKSYARVKLELRVKELEKKYPVRRGQIEKEPTK